MSIQDTLRGMLYSSGTVSHQNAAIYSSAVSEAKREPYTISDFNFMWKDLKKNVIYRLKEKFPIKFDYIFQKDNSILIYLHPEDMKREYRLLKADDVINYESPGQIKISPTVNRKDNTISKISIQSKYSMYGDTFNTKSVDIVMPDEKMDDLVSQIVDMAYTLTKNLNLL